MRRPQPLPPPGATPGAPVSGAPAGEGRPNGAPRDRARATTPGGANIDTRETASVEEPAATSAGPAAEEEHLAPVVPLGGPKPLPGAATASGTESDLSTADPDPVRLRDVWAATRARRKAERAEVRRFTARQRRRRAVWLGVAASLALLVLGTLGAAYSPLFAVETITVVGTDRLDAAAVEQSLVDQVGTPLPLVDESEVKAALVGFPLVETYTLEARPPHELVVRIAERTPIGYLPTAAGFTLVDAAGVALSTASSPGSDAPVLDVDGGADSAAFEAVGEVMRSLPDSVSAQVTEVAASTPDDVTLTLGDSGARVVWGSADDSAMKAVVLETVMTARPPDTVSVYDVSSPEAVVVG